MIILVYEAMLLIMTSNSQQQDLTWCNSINLNKKLIIISNKYVIEFDSIWENFAHTLFCEKTIVWMICVALNLQTIYRHKHCPLNIIIELRGFNLVLIWLCCFVRLWQTNMTTRNTWQIYSLLRMVSRTAKRKVGHTCSYLTDPAR